MSVFLWLLAVEFLGLLAVPFAFVLLKSLRDRGYAFSKPLGLLLFAYPVWLLGSLGVPVTSWLLGLVLALLALASGPMAWRQRDDLAAFLRREWRLVLGLEAVFLLLFLGWTAYRAYHPMVHHTEQVMDFALLTTNARATAYPPPDLWLQGHGVSYYYFGYLKMGLLARLTSTVPEVAYNLALALVPALASVGVLGLGVTLVNRAGASLRIAFGFGLAGVALLGLVGNGEGALEFARARGWGSEAFWRGLGVKGLEAPLAEAAWFPTETWWWWRATRVIDTLTDGRSLDYTIQEFPLFSFFLGDLHPHMMSLPFLLLALALGLELVLKPSPSLSLLRLRSGQASPLPGERGKDYPRTHSPQPSFGFAQDRPRPHGRGGAGLWERTLGVPWPWAVATGLAVGALGFINAWDLPPFLGLTLGLVALKGYSVLRQHSLRQTIPATLLLLAALVAMAIFPYLPYYLNVSVPFPGVVPVASPVTQPAHLLIVWGPFLVALTPFLALQLFRSGEPFSSRRLMGAAALALAPFLAWVLAIAALGVQAWVSTRFLHLAPGLLALVLVLYRALEFASRPPSLRGEGVSVPPQADPHSPPLPPGEKGRVTHASEEAAQEQDTPLLFTLCLLALAGFLLLGPELFRVQDVFNNRMNTVFKLYYQVWALLAVAAPMGLYYGARTLARPLVVTRAGGLLWLLLLVGALGSGAYYATGALTGKAGGFRGSPSLDGLAYLKQERPGEYEAIAWLRQHARPGEGILEAVGEWETYNLISAATGLPTVLGWPGHQRQWRGSFQPLEGRADEVATVYQSADAETVRRILIRYSVRYVIVGPPERQAYGAKAGAAIRGLAEPVFSQGGVTIYRVRERDG